MTDLVPPPRRNKQNPYREDEIHEYLGVLAVHGGNLKWASEFIKEQDGHGPEIATLRRWRDETYSEMYLSIRDRTAALRERLIVDKLEPMLERNLEGIALGIEKSIEALEQGRVKDEATATMKLATTFGIMTDKKFAYQGRPSSYSAPMTGAQLFRRLMKSDVDGSAEEDLPKGIEE